MSRHGFSEPFQGFLSIPPSSNPLRKRSIYQHPNVTYEKTRDAERLSGLHRVSEVSLHSAELPLGTGQ